MAMESSRNCLLLACVLSVAIFVNCDPTPGDTTPAAGAPTPAGAAPPVGGPLPPLPPITTGASVKDVLGDAEKQKVCASTFATCCATVGLADESCLAIAKAVGETSDPSCSAVKTCKFTVTKPVQHPDKPGTAYITTRDNLADYGVIFPCNNNPLVVVVPKKELGGN